MHRIRIYVDTSVFGGTQDEEFASASAHVFERAAEGRWTLVFSQVVLDELSDAPAKVQQVLKDLPSDCYELLSAPAEVEELAQAYIDAGIVGPSCRADAIHVATATVTRTDVIVSWNFRHIVNYDRIHKYNAINALNGYPGIDIHSPLEMEYGDEA